MAESPGYPGVIAARYENDNVPTDLGMDDDSKSLNVNLRTWNTSTLAWERMTSPAIPLFVTDDYADTLYYYDGDGNMEYMCQHSTHGTATSATDWIITKLTYGDDGITNRERLAGSVDGRAGLSWR